MSLEAAPLGLSIDVARIERTRKMRVSGALSPPLPCMVRVRFEGRQAESGLTGTKVSLGEPGSWEYDEMAPTGSYEVEDKRLMMIPGIYLIWSEALTPPPLELPMAKSDEVEVRLTWR